MERVMNLQPLERGTKRIWKMSEIGIIQKKYGSTATKELARELGCTTVQLNNRARKMKLVKDPDYKARIRSAKTLRMLELIRLLLRGDSLVSITEKLGVDVRVVHSYISILRYMDIDVKVDHGRYFIEPGKCPICNQQPHE